MSYVTKNGWRKDKYNPLAKLFLPRFKPEELPDFTNNWPNDKIPRRRDQGNEGACTGFGTGINISALAMKAGIIVDPSTWFSPRWAYNGGRYRGGYLDEEGAMPDDVVWWLENKEALPERFWKYQDGDHEPDNAPPASSLEPEAAKFPVIKGNRVVDGLNGILSALAEGQPVSFGGPYADAWMNTDEEGKVPEITKKSSIAGGHEWCFFDYDRRGSPGWIKCANSWSEEWGLSGIFYVPMTAIDVMKKIKGYDAHVFNVDWKTPEPAPTPTPAAVPIVRMQVSNDAGKTWQRTNVSI
jgi:hypothetical protein